MNPDLEDFISQVNQHIDLRNSNRFSSYMGFAEWRKTWVQIFSQLIDSLDKYLAVRNTENNIDYFNEHERDREIILEAAENFIGKTELNHILDNAVEIVGIFDCILLFATIIQNCVGWIRYDKIYTSYQFRRITDPSMVMYYFMIKEGHLNQTDFFPLDEVLDVVAKYPFPIREYEFLKHDRSELNYHQNKIRESKARELMEDRQWNEALVFWDMIISSITDSDYDRDIQRRLAKEKRDICDKNLKNE